MPRKRTPIPEAALVIRGLALDSRRYTATLDGQPLALTVTEFLLLFSLLVHPGWVITRRRLLDILWAEDDSVNEHSVDSHVKNIRKKLRAIRPDDDFILSVYGIGYKSNGHF